MERDSFSDSENGRAEPIHREVLLDNSSYFSFKTSIVNSTIDAESLYVLATIVEAIVTEDALRLAPTSAWAPDGSDTDLGVGAVIQPLTFAGWTAGGLADLFGRAITDAIDDVKAERVRLAEAEAGEVIDLMLDWLGSAKRDPFGFLQVYSGGVFITDRGSLDVLRSIPTSVDESMPRWRHVAQYLLRTNVAVELSTGMPYHPHPDRMDFVVGKFADRQSRGVLARRPDSRLGSMGTALLLEAEAVMEHQSQTAADSFVGAFVPQVRLGGTPLALAYVLKKATRPADIVPLAQELSLTSEARRYRDLTRIPASDPKSVLEKDAEVERARVALDREIAKRVGFSGIPATARFGFVVDATARELADLQQQTAARTRAAGHVVKWVGQVWRHRRDRRKISLITKLAAKSQGADLGDSIHRVFHVRLDGQELDRFFRLRRRRLGGISGRVSPGGPSRHGNSGGS